MFNIELKFISLMLRKSAAILLSNFAVQFLRLSLMCDFVVAVVVYFRLVNFLAFLFLP